MYVLSGKCRLCDTGQETNIRDIYGNELCTGDIVITFTEDYLPDNLTVVVSDQYESFTDGTVKEKDGDPEHFVMGIKNVDLDDEDNTWRVRRLKRFDEVVDGEHWKEYGFRFVSDDGRELIPAENTHADDNATTA